MLPPTRRRMACHRVPHLTILRARLASACSRSLASEALALRVRDRGRDDRRQPRRLRPHGRRRPASAPRRSRARRSSGSSTTTSATPRARCSRGSSSSTRSPSGSSAATASTSRSGGDRAPPHASRAGDPLPPRRRARDRDRGPLDASTARAEPGSRAGRSRCVARASAHSRDRRSSACSCCPAEWAGKRTIRYVEPGRRRPADAAAATIFLEHAIALPR